jgi:hypothetical protein
MKERIIIFLLVAVVIVAAYALVQAVSLLVLARKERAAMEKWRRDLDELNAASAAAIPAPAPAPSFAVANTVMSSNVPDDQEIAEEQAMEEVARLHPGMPVPPLAPHRRLNIGGQVYDVPDMQEGGDLQAYERDTINSLMLRRGRALMAEHGMTPHQAAQAVQEMVAHAGIPEVAQAVTDPLNLVNAMQDRTITPDQRLRLAEDMMMRHAENLIRSGVPVETAAERAADWGMQFAQFKTLGPADRNPTVQEVWRD